MGDKILPSMRCHARPYNLRASRNLLCSSSVHRSLCFVIVYGFLVCKIQSIYLDDDNKLHLREKKVSHVSTIIN